MSRRSPRPIVPACLAAALSLLGAVASAAPAGSAPARRPNVIILLTDDQGYGDLSCHGNPVLKTPNLDRLHDQGIRLTDFHVAPMCTPTRGQLMTGRDALHTGASSVCAGRSFIRRGTPTMAEVFASSGYRTAHFGKWHLGDSYPNLPHQRGFQETVYHLGWGITSIADLWENDYFDGRFRHNGTLRQYKGYCTDVWFGLAMDWIRQQKGRDEPFFLYLPTNAPHGPLWCPDSYKEPYQGKGPAAFFGMIANIDENLGKLDDLLSEAGLRDDTILIFFNDNGGTAGVNVYNAGMRGRKTQYYEGGHRAACFIRWPNGGLRAPRDLDALTEVQDLLPTLIDLCGLRAPEGARFEGTSLAGLLRGTTDTLPDRTLVVQYGQRPVKWDSAVMRGKWRLVRGKELYDLKADPGQANDVASRHPDVVVGLRAYYETWWDGVLPTLDDFSPISVGSDRENPVALTAADWANVYCDNMSNVREGINRNGPWHLLVERDGTYEVELRRWPREADAAMAAPVPAFKAVDGGLPAGKALPVARARLKLGDLDETKPVGPEDKGVTFTLAMKAGTKLPMQTWLYDAEGKELCGAYFAYVLRK
jgi:arylsulfatase A-like enzyme